MYVLGSSILFFNIGGGLILRGELLLQNFTFFYLCRSVREKMAKMWFSWYQSRYHFFLFEGRTRKYWWRKSGSYGIKVDITFFV